VDRRWIYGGLLLAGGIGVARLVTAHPKVRVDTRLLLIGDSLAQGLSPHLKELSTEEGVPYLGAGVSGTRIDQWIHSQWLDSALRDFDPTLVLVSLGTNDAYSNLEPHQIVEYTKALLERLGDEVEVVWVGVPALPPTYGGRSPKVELLEAIEQEAPYYFESHDLEIPRGPDGLHPTAHGYAGWAGSIWDWLT